MIYSKDKAVKVLAEVLESCCDVNGFVLACFSRTAITQGSFGVHEVMGRNVVDALVRQQLEIEKLKEELAAYKNANDPMGGGLRSLEWRFVWHGSGGNENWNRRGGRIFTNLTNGDELLYVGENKSDLDDAELLIAKHNADLLFVAQSKQAQIDRLKEALTGMVNHESAANAREGLEPSMELQFAQEVLGLVKLTGITKKEIDFQKYKKLIESEINVLGLNTRPYKILKAHGINTVRELARLTAIDLLKMPSMGRANFKNVTQQLEKHGLKLPDRSVQP